MRCIYTYRYPCGEVVRISADLAEANAFIWCVTADDDPTSPVPYQTADARHTEAGLLDLVTRYYPEDVVPPDMVDEDEIEARLAAEIAGAVQVACVRDDGYYARRAAHEV